MGEASEGAAEPPSDSLSDGLETKAAGADTHHVRITLHADPFATLTRHDAARSAGSREGIEHGAPLLAHLEHRLDHQLRDRVPQAVRMRARKRQHPAERG